MMRGRIFLEPEPGPLARNNQLEDEGYRRHEFGGLLEGGPVDLSGRGKEAPSPINVRMTPTWHDIRK